MAALPRPLYAMAAILAALALAGCLDDPAVRCADGTLCPSGTTCAVVAGATRCTTDEQRQACAGAAPGAPCDLTGDDDGVCNAGVCIRRGCGDGFLTLGERCDGAELGGETCASRGYNGGALGCTASCEFDTSACEGRCGDGVVSDDEDCDPGAPEAGIPPDLAGQTCALAGFYVPDGLGCTAGCRFDTRGCGGGRCGDGVVDDGDGEECDGAAAGAAATCRDLGFYGDQALACTAACRYDRVACRDQGFCGDGALQAGEVCDPGLPLDADHDTCGDFGFYNTTTPIRCGPICQYDVGACVGRCGDGAVDTAAGEECDGDPPSACATFGGTGYQGIASWYGGDVVCTPSCRLDGAACTTAGYCGDRRRNGAEACDAGPSGGDSDVAGNDFGGQSCGTGALFADGLPRNSGNLRCTPSCAIDTRFCAGYCGDRIINGREACDTDEFPGDATCQSLGWQTGQLLCLTDCQQIFVQCDDRCGDGVVQGTEACDGATQRAADASCDEVGRHGALGCTSSCQLATDACERTRWSAIAVDDRPSPTPGAEAVRAMWSGRRRDVWAVVGDEFNRQLLHGDGRQWIDGGPGLRPTALTGRRDGTVWTNHDAQVVQLDPSPTSVLELVPPLLVGDPLDAPPVALWADESRLFAATATRVWRWTGASWLTERTAVGDEQFVALQGLPGGQVYALADRAFGATLHERSATGVWTSAPVDVFAETYRALWVHSPASIWVAGEAGGMPVIGQRRHGGWHPLFINFDPGQPRLDGAAVGIGGEPDELWIAGGDGDDGWLITSDGRLGGDGFTRVLGSFPTFTGLTVAPTGEAWAFGAGRRAVHRDGPGLVTPNLPGTDVDLSTIRGRMSRLLPVAVAVTTTDVFFAGDGADGVIHHRPAAAVDDPGLAPPTRWVHELVGEPIRAVAARTDSEVWAFGLGAPWRWNGASWGRPGGAAPSGFRTSATIAGVLYVVDDNDQLWRHAGATWQVVATVPPGLGLALGGTGPNDLWVGGLGLARWNGVAFEVEANPWLDEITGIWAGSRDDVWLVGRRGQDGGLAHRDLEFGGFRRVAGAAPDLAQPLRAIWGAAPDDLWAVGDGGVILHYDGLRWAPVSPTAGAIGDDLRVVAGLDAEHAWIWGESGALFRLRAALPPIDAPPCANAQPLYCAGLDGGPGLEAMLPVSGTIPLGGTVLYRVEPAHDVSIFVRLVTAAANELVVEVVAPPPGGACTSALVVASRTVTASVLEVPLQGPTMPQLEVDGRRPFYVRVRAPGATAPLGFELTLQCGDTTF